MTKHHEEHAHADEEMRDLSDEELALVSGGALPYQCPCGKHTKQAPTDM